MMRSDGLAGDPALEHLEVQEESLNLARPWGHSPHGCGREPRRGRAGLRAARFVVGSVVDAVGQVFEEVGLGADVLNEISKSDAGNP